MTELAFMPFYPADWLLDTQDLSADGYMAYHRLICNMWVTRTCTLPFDHQVLRRRAGFTPQKWPHVWAEIEEFFTVENGQVGHQKLTSIRGKARDKYAARSEAGRKGAEAKWRKNKGSGNGKANGKPYDKRDRNQNQSIINNTAHTREGEISDIQKEQAAADQAKAEAIKSGKRFLCTQITAVTANRLIEAGHVTPDECKAVGVL